MHGMTVPRICLCTELESSCVATRPDSVGGDGGRCDELGVPSPGRHLNWRWFGEVGADSRERQVDPDASTQVPTGPSQT